MNRGMIFWVAPRLLDESQHALHLRIEMRPGLYDKHNSHNVRIFTAWFSHKIDPAEQPVPDLLDQFRQPEDVALWAGLFPAALRRGRRVELPFDVPGELAPVRPGIPGRASRSVPHSALAGSRERTRDGADGLPRRV